MSEDTNKTPRFDPQGSPALRGDKDGLGETSRVRGKRRRKVSYLTVNKIDHVDYKEINILRRFLNDRGKILPSRQSGNTAKQQRMIARAIRQAREMALLPFVVTEMTADRREYGARRERNYRDDRGPRDGNRDDRRDDRGPREDRAPRESAPAPAAAPAPAE